MHLNLPYSNQKEFVQLHSLIRLMLPLIPALAASSPILDGKPTGMLDSRLYFYEKNQQLIPSISGELIPEFIASEKEYLQTILAPMYKDISALDPTGILQHEWLNSRAAIPKFNQKAIEIRIIDSQECVDSDIAIAKGILAILKHWQHNFSDYLNHPIKTKVLKSLFDKAIIHGLSIQVDDTTLLKQWGLPARSMTLFQVWSSLIETISSQLNTSEQLALEHILNQGNLSQRILKATGTNPDKNKLKETYKELGHCLLANQKFECA
jgi:gamma-glutamyl:cysteine ligase YbdK (ATP-grasp superfamily)